MSKKFVLLALMLVFMMLFVGSALAQSGLPGSGWWSGEQVQNIGSATANIVVTAYDKDSTSTYQSSQQVNAGESFTFLPRDFAGMPDGFMGSAVVSSDQPMAAIVNVTNRQSGSNGVAGGLAAAQYQGVDGDAVAERLDFPLVKGDSFGKTTTFFIQNAGGSATTATATFTMRNGDTHTYTTPSIGANQMVVFSVLDASTFNPSDNAGRVGSLVVQSNTGGVALAGTVLEHATTENPATSASGTRAFTSDDYDTTLIAPVVKHNRGNRFTGLQIQNVSGGPINVTVTYVGSSSTCRNQTYVDTVTGIAANSAHTIVHNRPSNTNLAADCTASATIVATGNAVAIVNEAYTSDYINAGNTQRATTYSAMSNSNATTQISAPLFKDARFGKFSGLQVANVSGAEITDLVATFNCRGAATFTAVSQPQTVAAGGAFLFVNPSSKSIWTTANPFSSNNVNCSATVTAGGNIVGIVNEGALSGTDSEDRKSVV